MKGRVLIVEDEELVGSMVALNLELAGYEVAWIANGHEGLDRAETDRFDLILLDITLPGLDGIEILDRLRRAGVTTPIMMMTARGDVATKVEALGIGADDYLSKPFDVNELVARAGALVRRSQAERELPSDRLIRIGRCTINLETRQAIGPDGDTPLTEKEAALVAVLARARGRVVSRAAILEEVWGMDVFPTERTVDNFVLRVRRLIEDDPERPQHLITVRGAGYRLEI